MTSRRVVVVGDTLLDRDVVGQVERLCPDAPVPVFDQQDEYLRPGGAGLAAVLAASGGRRVTLVTALADDDAGRRLRRLLADAGVDVVDLGLRGPTPEKVRVWAAGRSLLRVDRGGPPAEASVGPCPATVPEVLADGGTGAVLVADYGRGVAAEPGVRRALIAGPPTRPVVWDPHPRGPEPAAGVCLVTPNRAEAARFSPDVADGGSPLAVDTARARALCRRWRAAVAVTLGDRGALFVDGDAAPLLVPARPVTGDPCGAGDRFSSAAAELLADGALPSEAVTGAVAAATAFVAGGGASTVGRPSNVDAAVAVAGPAARARGAGGTLVAAGGCFDLLHAGHVRLLEQARALGDCLVVLLNSDASVRRLKGPGRPLVTQADRAAVLLGLACVDAVEIFDEDTPAAALGRLRPDIFAKGGDYSLDTLPEVAVLAEWGGQAVLLPYLKGRSTSRMVQEVVRSAG